MCLGVAILLQVFEGKVHSFVVWYGLYYGSSIGNTLT